ncbi:two-partner secretion domain-containing protein [Nostoc sp.]|uniref:two-partner secretion domain-containing protein n=1 Tax=Nostoc sp. TaxID=1180 RepID=UPI002FF685DA
MGPSRFSAPDRSKNPVGLSVSSNNTLALIGGEIGLDGGVLNAPSGHIELASVRTDTVNLNTALPAWGFDYTNVQQLEDIQFSHQALADSSGTPAGSIHIQGQNISLIDGSVALYLAALLPELKYFPQLFRSYLIYRLFRLATQAT